MINILFIICCLNLILTIALCIREWERQREASKSVEQFSNVIAKMEAPPFQEPDWLSKLRTVLESKKEVDEGEGGVTPGHLIEDYLASIELRETSEERELTAEEKAERHFTQERGLH